MKKKYLALASSILLLSPFVAQTNVQAHTLDELNREKQQLEQETEDVQNKISEKESSLKKLEDEKNELQANVEKLQESINLLLSQLEEQEQKLTEIENKITALIERIEELRIIIEQRTEKLNNQARVIQTEASMTDFVTIVANSESFTDLIGKVGTVNKLITANKEIVVQQEDDKREVEETKAQVEEEKVAAEQLKQEIIISKNNVVAQQDELNVQIGLVLENVALTEQEKSGLESTKAKLMEQTKQISTDIAAEEKRIEEERIAREKAEAERVAREKAEAEKLAQESAEESLVASVTNTPVNITGNNSSGFIRPASGYNSSPYGYRINPVDGGYRMHNGTDIAGSGPIIAAQSGTVETAGFDATYGYHVVINHGTINGKQVKTKYAHMTAGLQVAPGQQVQQGQQIGTMGTTGQSTGVHLHFEVFENGSQVNPLNYISL